MYKNIIFNDMRKHALNIWGRKTMNKVEKRRKKTLKRKREAWERKINRLMKVTGKGRE